jgi:hypothetical protein
MRVNYYLDIPIIRVREGVLEYWSDGVMELWNKTTYRNYKCVSQLTHYSNAPVLQIVICKFWIVL